MNVAFVSDSVTHQIGGSFRSTLKFAEFLTERGHKVIIFAAKYPGTKDIDFYGKVKIYRFRSVPMPKTEGMLRFCFPTIKEVKDILLKEDINVLHATIPTPSMIVAIKAAESLGIKIVAHSHTQSENILWHLPKVGKVKTVHSLFNKYLLWLYKKADVVICVSKFGEKLLRKYDPTLKIVVISNGVDTLKFKKMDPTPFFKKYNLSKKEKRILFVGRLHAEKSVNTLIRSMPYVLKEFSNAHLDIVGRGYLSDSLKELSGRLNLQGHVKFFGYLPDEELAMAYNACDIFVLPSLIELEGMVILEVMACGKPIVIANSKDSASVDFVDGNGLLFRPNDPKDLADKLLVLLKNEQLRKKMANASYKKSRYYDVEMSVSLLEKVYSSIVRPKQSHKRLTV